MINLNNGWFFALKRGFVTMEREDAKELEYMPVVLPHDWAISSPLNQDMECAKEQGFRDRWGIGWYKRTLELSEKQEKRYRLCFGGIYENSTVWVNGMLVGGRKYGYSSFCVDISEPLQSGKNEILIKVDNTSVPADRWYSGAGIYRGVKLQILPKEHLNQEDIQIEQVFHGNQVELLIHTGVSQMVRAVLKKGNEEYRVEGSERVLRIPIPDCIFWSAEQPELYELKLQLLNAEIMEENQITMKIGIRDMELSPERGLFINKKPVKLKGVCLHQEAGCLGIAVGKEIWKERLLKLKEIGCNALRFAHHMPMPELLDLCDELGFYVYEECFDKWTGGAYGRYYETEWEKDLSCMVKRDRNHPCILFWGVGNEVENQAQDSMVDLLGRHVDKIRELDRSRYVSVAMNPHFGYPTGSVDMSQVKDIQQFVDEMKTGEIVDMDDRVERIKLIASKVDFLCCNYQEQWYDRIHKAIPDKAILGTETYMYFRGLEENFQNYTDQNPWFDVVKHDYCIGGMIWTGIDYLGESMDYPAKGWSGALFATDMEKRSIAWLYQSYWTKEPMVHFAVMDYSIADEGVKEHWDYPRYVSHWDFPQFHRAVIPYMVATNCQQIEISVNGKKFFVKSTAEFPNHMITGFLPYIPGTVTIVGKNDGKEVCRQIVKTSGMAVKLAFEEEEKIICLHKDDGWEEMQTVVPFQLLLKVHAVDETGSQVFRESGKVQFMVEGPAQMIGVDNGDMMGAEPYHNDFIHLFHGRANAALRITGEGRIRVTAYAAGMMMAQTVLIASVHNR